MISSGIDYISCWMTMTQIEKMKTKKIFFSNLDWLTSVSFFPQFTPIWNAWNLSGRIPISFFLSFFAAFGIVFLIVWVDADDTKSQPYSPMVISTFVTIYTSHCSKTPFVFNGPEKNFENGLCVEWGWCLDTWDSENNNPFYINFHPSLRGGRRNYIKRITAAVDFSL